MADLNDLAEQCQRNAIAWDAGHPHLSGEVCARWAEDWDALHTLALAAGAWVERLDPTYPDIVLRAEEEAVAACRRLAEHLRSRAMPEDLEGVDRDAVKTLIAHTRTRIEGCRCGWGMDASELGQSHALHVWRELQRAVLPDHDARVRAEETRPSG